MDKFLNIAITVPYFYPGEAADIEQRLVSGRFDYVHVRKPGCSAEQLVRLLNAVNPAVRERLTLHDHFSVAAEYGVGGVHLNSRNPDAPVNWSRRVSRSCHSVKECAEVHGADYVFISPVFPSISKPGYKNDFDEQELAAYLAGAHSSATVALGGVTQERVEQVRRMRFDGYAMLADAWRPHIDLDKFCLQFITNPESVQDAVKQTRAVLSGGGRWIQLRWKDAATEDLVAAGTEIADLCRQSGAVFLLDDHVALVNVCSADGVHLGKNDMPVAEARAVLGPGCIIGATANTPDDIVTAAGSGADYIGYGPFRFTTTKKNLSPVLGLEGYRKAVAECLRRGISLPIVAIGGITDADIPDIMATGVNGVAVSGSILKATVPSEATALLRKTILDITHN